MCWRHRAKQDQADANKALKSSTRMRWLRYLESLQRKARHQQLRGVNHELAR